MTTHIANDWFVVHNLKKAMNSSLYKMHKESSIVRKVTPEECEEFQTLPIGYTNVISNSRRFHAIGNCWTVDVIVEILKDLT